MPEPDDPHRPIYHFTPPRNWMNDPIPFYDPATGLYHIFYQHNPNRAEWGDMHWGHAVSRDLRRWENVPVAIAPTPGGPDTDGIWTGCVTRRADGAFAALYTGIPHLKDPFVQTQCLATSGDLLRWQKWSANPIIPSPPAGTGPCFRDPQVFAGPDRRTYMVVGGEQPGGKGGLALLYRAEDATLTRWTPLPPLFAGGPETGHEFECPDFFPLGKTGKWLLLTSSGRTWWHIGTLTPDMRFVREAWGACDGSGFGGGFYAAKTLLDASGLRLLFGWVTEGRPGAEQLAAGWSGALSLPRVIMLGPDGLPRFFPPRELERLRGAHRRRSGMSVPGDGRTVLLPDVAGDALELSVRFAPSTAARCGVVVRGAADGSGGVRFAYDPVAGSFEGTPLRLAAGEGLSLRIFVDRSVVEVFAGDGRVCVTRRIYPDRPAEAVHVGLFSEGAPAVAERVESWEMRRA